MNWTAVKEGISYLQIHNEVEVSSIHTQCPPQLNLGHDPHLVTIRVARIALSGTSPEVGCLKDKEHMIHGWGLGQLAG